MLQVTGHINWKTPKNRSIEYVQAIQKELGDRIIVNKQTTRIIRTTDTTGKSIIAVTDQHGQESVFDEVSTLFIIN